MGSQLVWMGFSFQLEFQQGEDVSGSLWPKGSRRHKLSEALHGISSTLGAKFHIKVHVN